MFEKLKTDVRVVCSVEFGTHPLVTHAIAPFPSAQLAASLTRLEIVDNGATDLGTHLFVVVNRQGADVAGVCSIVCIPPVYCPS